jgi:hypothetical protein
MPDFVETVDEDGNHSVMAKDSNKRLWSEWLVDETEFERFLVKGLLVGQQQALALIPKVLRSNDGTDRFDLVSFLTRWTMATR